METRFSRCFAWSAGATLLTTGLAKVLSGLGHARILELADPILGLSFGRLMVLVGAAELALATLCFSRSVSPHLKAGLVAWLATNFLFYRFGLWAIGWQHPCHCMGSLAGVLHLSDQTADSVMKWVLAYLLMGSYLVLTLEWKSRKLEHGPRAGGVSRA
jgi:hypothetical protein